VHVFRSFRYIVPQHLYVIFHTITYVYLYPTAFPLRLFGIWLTVLLTVDRYIAVWYPLDAKRLCTVRRTWLLMLAIAVGSVAFSVPRFFEYKLV
jgi:hypothetical protein